MKTLLGLILLTAAQAAIGQKCGQNGQCVQSDLVYMYSTVVNSHECLKLCKDNQDCQWYSYQPGLKYCTLYKNCKELSTENCDGCSSGEVTCSAECGLKGSCSASALHETTAFNGYDCLRKCKLSDICKWYTYDYSNGHCSMFKECSYLTESKNESTSGLVTCPQKMNGQILISHGDVKQNEEPLKSSDVFDTILETSKCQIPYDHESLGGAIGGLLYDSIPFVCGGTENPEYCYILGNPEPVTKMSEKRYGGAGAVIHGSTLFIVDGTSSEYVKPGLSVPGPDLPQPIRGQCLVNYNSTHLMMIGGFIGLDINSTYFFNIQNEEWIRGPDLNVKRKWHSCGLVHDEEENPIVVVIGGWDINHVELLFANSDSWVEGPEVPFYPNIALAKVVNGVKANELYLIGGVTYRPVDHIIKNVHKLAYKDGQFEWLWTDIQMDRGRKDHEAFQVPDGLCQN